MDDETVGESMGEGAWPRGMGKKMKMELRENGRRERK